MNASHTPGPWNAYNLHKGRILQSWRVDSPSAPIATVHDVPTGAQLANADLIAAAPDLLAACEDTYAHFAAHFGTAEWEASESANTLRAAIAKAKGGAA